MTQAPAPQARPRRLDECVDLLARTPHLLIACDYDGTLSPIVSDPSAARPLRESIVALRTLAELPDTHVSVISGRALSDLAALTGLPERVHLVGSHGSEFEPGFTRSLTEAQAGLRKRIEDELRAIAGSGQGLTIETKPASVALHYRNAEPALAQRALDEAVRGPGGLAGVFVKHGKKVVELTVVETNKGSALSTIRQRVGAHAVLFIGDDVTDEDGFATLRGPDVGVKVGEGETAAVHRVADPHEVARLLAQLSERRAAWACGGAAVAIDHHSMLSDQRTIALVTPDARVSWMCAPRIDSPAIFAELLGGAGAGFFAVAPEDDRERAIRQAYVNDSLIVRTDFPSFEVTDYLDCSGGRTRQRAGRSDLVRVVRGSGRVTVTFAPRLDFGRTPTALRAREGGLEVLDSPEPIVLYAPGLMWCFETDGPHQTAVAHHDLSNGPLVMTLRLGVGTLRAPLVDGEAGLDETHDYWRRWSHRLRLPKLAREQVRRSALTLRGLVHGPSGGIAAAATTSLPETIGGVRNWDYRYCWPRDAAISALALVKLGSASEGVHLLDWLLEVLEHAVAPDRIAPLYAVTGEPLTTEGEIGELHGYAGSRPVRVGNAASRQVQLDVFGPVVELVYELAKRDAPLTPQHWRVVEGMAAAVQSRWHEPDHGIWEVRDHRRHHVHSKTMCWLTIDRALKSAELLRDRVPVGWAELRDAIGAELLERGWNERVGAFTASYEQDDLDAAALWVGLSGLVPADDPRFVRTVEAVERELRDGPGVYRYRFDDKLPGEEGVFHICTTWLIQCYKLMGRDADARELFDAYLGLVGPTGLMSEEYEVGAARALGNHPQAYSHAGLIECALMLEEG